MLHFAAHPLAQHLFRCHVGLEAASPLNMEPTPLTRPHTVPRLLTEANQPLRKGGLSGRGRARAPPVTSSSRRRVKLERTVPSTHE